MMFPQSLDDLISVGPSILQETLLNLEDYLLEDNQDLSVVSTNSSLAINPIDPRKRKSRKPSSDDQENMKKGVDSTADNKGKKILHREVEKQRRKEMTSLYASLRSLLPLEYIKGKRAVSDHMNEAVNYIKDMKKNIQEMSLRRDEIKKLSLRRDKLKKLHTSGSHINVMSNSVTVNPCKDGAEILILTGSEVGFPMSRVLGELIKLNLNVQSCVSSRTSDEKFHLHRILIELATASDPRCVNLLALKDRVLHEINFENELFD